MNKKNIILGLSLILSSVATLNLTSCSDDDDDDANHAPKSAVVENNQTSDKFTFDETVIKKAQTAKDSIKTQLGTDVKTYMANHFAGQYDNLAVIETSNKITIHFLTSKGDNTQKHALSNMLDRTVKKNSELYTMIKQNHPTTQLNSSESVFSKTQLYYNVTFAW